MAVFTDKFVRGLKPGAALYEERDAGCPGLLIRVGQRGGKVWEVVVSRDGMRRRVRLGSYPDVSLAMARRLASERKTDTSVHASSYRVRDLWEDYAAEMRPKRRAFGDVEYVWTKWAEPILGNVRLDDLNRRHGAELIAAIVRKSSANRARKAVRYLSPMLGFAAGRGLLPDNPWRGLAVPEGVAPRDRVLTQAEWAALWQWASAAPYPWGPFLRVLMLSAQRLGDVAGMRWDEIAGSIWTIPASRHKSKRRHEVPLSAALLTELGALTQHDPFVFSHRIGRPVVPGATLKARITRDLTAGDTPIALGDWRFHDLRRTGATFMGDGGVMRFVIERVLGHADQSVTAIYDRALYREEKRAALEVLAGTVRYEQ